MRILLTNDDGILAQGLAALREAVADLGEITVVAPDSPQSATGRAITLHGPVACQRVQVGDFWGISVTGRPADCVKLAVRELMDQAPDLVLAGINAGSNVGINVFYSGTVAAAAEGALFGIPSVAFSLAKSPGEPMAVYRRAARYCRWVLDGLLRQPMRVGELVNVNLPALAEKGPRSRPRGVKVVPQSTVAINEDYVRKDLGEGRWEFQLGEHYTHGPQDRETDVLAIEQGYVTVTPLKSDLTDRSRFRAVKAVTWGRPPA